MPTVPPDHTQETVGKEAPVVALFAGVGGIELGLHRAGGYRTVLAWELMEEARACLTDNLGLVPGRTARADVNENDFGRRLPSRMGVLTAGFPCQDLSQAGRTAGIHGSRSGLILNVLDALGARSERKKPDWILLENVAFMRHIGGGEAMRLVLSRLSSLGYSWAYRQVDTQAFGLPQRRKRVFFVACKYRLADPRAVLLTDDAVRPATPQGPGWIGLAPKACGFYWTEGNRGLGWAYDAIPPLKGGSTVQIPSPPAVLHPSKGLVLPTIEDAEALQGFDRGWTHAAVGKGRDRNGRMRWYLVGNAVSVPVSQWIGRRMRSPRPYPTLREAAAVPFVGGKWPAAAWQIRPDGVPMRSQESDWPLDTVTRKEMGLHSVGLAELLSGSERPQKLLSVRAASGFLKRFDASTLLKKSDPKLRDALIWALEARVGGETGVDGADPA